MNILGIYASQISGHLSNPPTFIDYLVIAGGGSGTEVKVSPSG